MGADRLFERLVTEDFYRHVGEHDDGAAFNEQERLAMEDAELFARDHQSINDAFFVRLRESFSDPETLDLTICLSVFLGLDAHCGCSASRRHR
jgi:alkylhydroperoxidase family enzyme